MLLALEDPAGSGSNAAQFICSEFIGPDCLVHRILGHLEDGNS